jgi:hypothetical protein
MRQLNCSAVLERKPTQVGTTPEVALRAVTKPDGRIGMSVAFQLRGALEETEGIRRRLSPSTHHAPISAPNVPPRRTSLRRRPYEDDDALRSLGVQAFLGVARALPPPRPAGSFCLLVDEFGAHLEHVADRQGPVARGAADINRDAALPTGPRTGGILYLTAITRTSGAMLAGRSRDRSAPLCVA